MIARGDEELKLRPSEERLFLEGIDRWMSMEAYN
jgi:hypothetical protein